MNRIIVLVHPKHGRVTVDQAQWDEKAHVTGWDEATARKNGFRPESEEAGKKIGAALDAAAAKARAEADKPEADPPADK